MYLTENEILKKAFEVIKSLMADEDVLSFDAMQGVLRMVDALLQKEDK